MTNGETKPRRRRPAAILLIVGALFIIVPFWAWYTTWFGRPLTDSQMASYLEDREKPRHVQHALTQLERRIRNSDSSARQWYPAVAALKDHASPEVRLEAAWVMGQDNTSEPFHEALNQLVTDGNPMVRRNAALGLVRFQDDRGHSEIVEMLRPFIVTAPVTGVARINAREGNGVAPGAIVARIEHGGETTDVRARVSGHIGDVTVRSGDNATIGDRLMSIVPDAAQVWEALRALYVIGSSADLGEVDRYAQGVSGMPDRVREQGVLTARAIRGKDPGH